MMFYPNLASANVDGRLVFVVRVFGAVLYTRSAGLIELGCFEDR